jgi:arsenate reductase
MIFKEKLRILFLCTGNSCRSQMAEGWATALKGGEIEAHSAGIEPKGLDKYAVKAMAEAGVDISHQYSKAVTEFHDITFDYVITVCGHAHENCPVFPGKAKIAHFGFEDPSFLARNSKTDEEKMGPYRRIRDEIKAFIETLPDSLPVK